MGGWPATIWWYTWLHASDTCRIPTRGEVLSGPFSVPGAVRLPTRGTDTIATLGVSITRPLRVSPAREPCSWGLLLAPLYQEGAIRFLCHILVSAFLHFTRTRCILLAKEKGGIWTAVQAYVDS